ncbi:MAG: amidase, partial [Pseudonocardiales bacterium]|nr:amidase [Pseudonocardiales bacterium]
MPLPPPDSSALRKVSDDYRLGLTPADAESFQPFVAGLLASWDTVEELYNETAPKAPERDWQHPAD